MRARRPLLVLAVLLSFVAAKRRGVDLPAPAVRQPIADVFSTSNPFEVHSTHLSIDLTVDLNTRSLRGSVTHTIEHLTSANQFIVDNGGLIIDGVKVDGKSVTVKSGGVAGRGSGLIIPIDPKAASVRIDYHTSPGATGAVHWLKAVETRSRSLPAMWTENEPDLGRTWIPMQDTPSNRVTYDATIHTPSNEMALMSASDNPKSIRSDGVYHFTMTHSIPTYLIALTIGQYAFRDLGNRTGVYSEPSLIDDTAYETQYVPDMLSAAERVLGPYPFERYDLVFPPKYPGGMENPELNFISQDFITTNHPAVLFPSNLIAHELAHAWFGDLLTCAEWNDLFLNEGFATYFAPRIDEEMGAPEVAGSVYQGDRQGLDSVLALNFPARLTVLHRTFQGTERPSFTTIYYNKGEMFLKTLETSMGRSAFDAMIARYVQQNREHWVDDITLRDVVEGDPAYSAAISADEWIYGSGLPSNIAPIPPSALQARIQARADAFRGGTPASQIDTTGWTEFDRQQFLVKIQDLIPSRMSELESAFHISELPTPPSPWLVSAAKVLDAPSKAVLDRYLSIGKYDSAPTWYALSQTNDGRAYANALFKNVDVYYDSDSRLLIAQYIGFTGVLP